MPRGLENIGVGARIGQQLFSNLNDAIDQRKAREQHLADQQMQQNMMLAQAKLQNPELFANDGTSPNTLNLGGQDVDINSLAQAKRGLEQQRAQRQLDAELAKQARTPVKLGYGEIYGTPAELRAGGGYRAPDKPSSETRNLRFERAGGKLLGYDPVSGKQVSEQELPQGYDVKQTPTGLWVGHPDDPKSWQQVPGTVPAPAAPKYDVGDRKTVEVLSGANAQKESIANQIDAALHLLEDPKSNEKTNIKVGQSLYKILNSAEGKDAVGAEEAKRIGSLMEFNLPSIKGAFDPVTPFFGRDYKGFIDQIKATRDTLRRGTSANSALIEKVRGKYGGAPDTGETSGPATAEDYMSKKFGGR